jgi:hypothetical protein
MSLEEIVGEGADGYQGDWRDTWVGRLLAERVYRKRDRREGARVSPGITILA